MDWERDADTADGYVLAVEGDSADDRAALVAKLKAAGLTVSESRDDSGRWILVVAA
jgi:hypothetical protein